MQQDEVLICSVPTPSPLDSVRYTSIPDHLYEHILSGSVACNIELYKSRFHGIAYC